MTSPLRASVRTRREGWAAESELVVTARDLSILYFAGVCGLVRTRDIMRMFFGSRGTATDRLRKLYVAKYLHVFVRDLAADNLYGLSERGRDLLVEQQGIDAEVVRVVRKVPAKLDHALAILDVRVHLALACGASGRYALAEFTIDRELASVRPPFLDILPDALVTVDDTASGASLSFCLECDRATESASWLAGKKLAAYARAAATRTPLFGLVDPLVALVVPGLRRARTVARALAAAQVRPRVVFALASYLREHNVLGAAYATLDDVLDPSSGDRVEEVFARRLLP